MLKITLKTAASDYTYKYAANDSEAEKVVASLMRKSPDRWIEALGKAWVQIANIAAIEITGRADD